MLFYTEMLWKLHFEGPFKCIVSSTFPGRVACKRLYWLIFWKPTILLHKIIFLPVNGTSGSTEILYGRPWVCNEMHRANPYRAYLTESSFPGRTNLHDKRKLFSKHGGANTAVDTQVVPCVTLCIIKKIGSSVLIPKSSLCWCREQKKELHVQNWAGPTVGPNGKQILFWAPVLSLKESIHKPPGTGNVPMWVH